MKFSILVVGVVAFLSLNASVKAEDTTAHNGEAGTNRNKTSTPTLAVNKDARLFELTSACMAGRAFPASQHGGAALPSLPSGTSANATSSAAGAAVSAGEAVLTSNCISCHANAVSLFTGPKATEAIRRVNIEFAKEGHMPKAATLTDSDKTALISYLNTKK